MGLKGNKQINETRAGLCRSTELVTSQKSTMNYPKYVRKEKVEVTMTFGLANAILTWLLVNSHRKRD